MHAHVSYRDRESGEWPPEAFSQASNVPVHPHSQICPSWSISKAVVFYIDIPIWLFPAPTVWPAGSFRMPCNRCLQAEVPVRPGVPQGQNVNSPERRREGCQCYEWDVMKSNPAQDACLCRIQWNCNPLPGMFSPSLWVALGWAIYTSKEPTLGLEEKSPLQHTQRGISSSSWLPSPLPAWLIAQALWGLSPCLKKPAPLLWPVNGEGGPSNSWVLLMRPH